MVIISDSITNLSFNETPRIKSNLNKNQKKRVSSKQVRRIYQKSLEINSGILSTDVFPVDKLR